MVRVKLREFGFFGIFSVAVLAIFSCVPVASAGTETQITNDLADQFAPYISGDKIVWEDWRDTNNPEIYMYDLATQTENRITDSNWGQYMPVVSGGKVFWTDFRPENMRRDIYMYDLATHLETRLINAPENQYVWNAYGNRIVWKDDRNIVSDIYTYDLTTQTETRVTNGSANNVIHTTPSISTDKIVWQATSANWNWDYEIYMYDLATQVTSKVVTDPTHNQQLPSIFGDKIVWQDGRNGNEDIYMYDLTTHTETQITSDSANQVLPKISGDKIVWLDGRNHNNSTYDIYMYDLTTNTESRITSDVARADGTLSISGDRIVWQDRRNGNVDVYMYELDAPPANVAPTARIAPISIVPLGQLATFDGSGSSDSGGSIVSFVWDFGDGSTGSGVSANHTYATTGTYQVTLTVTDNDGASNTASISVAVVRQLTTLAPAQVWVGIKNSDAVGIKFDLKAEVYKDGVLVTSGQLDSVSGGSSGFGNANLNTIPFASFSPVDFPAGSSLSVKVLARNACVGSGKNSGTARLWFNDSAADSQFGATITPTASDYYLLDGFSLGTSAGPGPKKNIDVAAGAKCSPFKEFGTWAVVPN